MSMTASRACCRESIVVLLFIIARNDKDDY